MKKIIALAALCFSLVSVAQQTRVTDSDYVIFSYPYKNENINMLLPKGAVANPDGTFVYDGFLYRIEAEDALCYLELSKKSLKEKFTEKPRELNIMAYFVGKKMGDGFTNLRTEMHSEAKAALNGDLIFYWYGYLRSMKSEMTEKMGSAKLMGDYIITINMNNKIDPQSPEMNQQKDLLFKILDSATIAVSKSRT